VLRQTGRCMQIDRNVEREIINHRMLNHVNIIGFKEVSIMAAQLCITRQHQPAGRLKQRFVRAG
jgi:serine/threonine-protein kinase SRK2